jgi:RNA polymerase sigma-70 factor (ECF subfamily)
MSTSLRTLLTSKLDPVIAEELERASDVDAILEGARRSGVAAHPDLSISDDAFVSFLATQLEPGVAVARLVELRAADVHLALACLAGNARAHALLDARLRAVAPQALSGIRLGTTTLDELLQDVRTKLLVGASQDVPAKLALYAGRGPLDGWLRVTLARAALSSVRGAEPARAASDDEVAHLAADDDPQLAALHARCGPGLERAIREAIAARDPEERTLLRLNLVERLSIDELAVLHKAHRATMARRLARARNAIFEDARTRAMESLGLDESEFRSLVGLVLSRLDLTLRSVLATRSGSEPG